MMLQMKQQCERCQADVHDQQKDVYICSYECTFCASCNETVFNGTCPNCGGDLVIRPTRKKKD